MDQASSNYLLCVLGSVPLLGSSHQPSMLVPLPPLIGEEMDRDSLRNVCKFTQQGQGRIIQIQVVELQSSRYNH